MGMCNFYCVCVCAHAYVCVCVCACIVCVCVSKCVTCVCAGEDAIIASHCDSLVSNSLLNEGSIKTGSDCN